VTIKSTGEVFKAGDVISINGSTGEVIRGTIPMETPTLEGNLGIIMDWAVAQPGAMKVMANADSGPDAAQAASHGSVGVGLCRTEHMFFAPERLPIVRKWIFNPNDGGLEQIKEFQRTDFRELFKAMDGKIVTVRMLDPPLHEFLPRPEKVTKELAEQLGFGGDTKAFTDAINAMHEENPMLGLRGCRLGIIHPDFTEMQVEAIMNAAADQIDENPKANPRPRIMIPLIGSTAEFKNQALICKAVAERINKERMVDIPYEIGTMIEVPRAALISDHIASLVDEKDGKPLCNFFSFGTNDLTQMTMGISRDDSNEFIPKYLEMGIIAEDPFKSIDEDGVGQLVKRSVADGLRANPNLSLSVCGEHGGDPKSISFFHEVGLNYVSCSPFRGPVARLAAGQAAVRHLLKQNSK
jgi:pyruvate,orthophosphate dikinase